MNGSLWSLRYEALTYVFLLLLWTLLRQSRVVAGVIVVAALLTWTVPFVENAILGVAYTLPYFAGGVVMNWVHRRYGTNRYGAGISVVLLLVACRFNLQMYAFAFFGAYLVVFLGERQNPGSRLAEKIGDCSYGMYLYGWPAEQIAKQLTLTTDPMRLLALALPVAFVLALISCHAIERPAMRPKRAVAAWIASWMAAFSPRRAAVLGAKAAFVVGTTIILLSADRSWQFLESMGQLLIGVLAGTMVAAVLYRAAAKLGIRESAIWRGKPARDLKRSAIFVHRWLGVALCVIFLLWFPSGIGMMYWDFPSVSDDDRLQRSPALNPATIRLSPGGRLRQARRRSAARSGAADDLRRPSGLRLRRRRRNRRWSTPTQESARLRYRTR